MPSKLPQHLGLCTRHKCRSPQPLWKANWVSIRTILAQTSLYRRRRDLISNHIPLALQIRSWRSGVNQARNGAVRESCCFPVGRHALEFCDEVDDGYGPNTSYVCLCFRVAACLVEVERSSSCVHVLLIIPDHVLRDCVAERCCVVSVVVDEGLEDGVEHRVVGVDTDL